jgi:hypothetical protein
MLRASRQTPRQSWTLHIVGSAGPFFKGCCSQISWSLTRAAPPFDKHAPGANFPIKILAILGNSYYLRIRPSLRDRLCGRYTPPSVAGFILSDQHLRSSCIWSPA